MFDLKFASADAANPLNTEIVRETVERVRKWLKEKSPTESLLDHLPALELALAAHVKNHDTELLSLVTRALDTIHAQAPLEKSSNAVLAAYILLNLRVIQVNRATRFQHFAHHAIEITNTRWDDKNAFFKTSVTDTANVFYADANARLGEAFYFAWRVFDEQPLRSKAGEILGQVSAMFDPNGGLYQRVELPDGAPGDSKYLAAYSAAVQMFLTASETTGRATYIPRAMIVAEYALSNLDTEDAPFDERARFADALLRLEQFTSIARYRDTAREILTNALAQIRAAVDASSISLAVEHAENFPLHVVVIGDVENDENARALWFAALNEYASTRAIEILHPTQHAARIRQLGYFVSDNAAARNAQTYICTGPLCLPPVSAVDALRRAIQHARNKR